MRIGRVAAVVIAFVLSACAASPTLEAAPSPSSEATPTSSSAPSAVPTSAPPTVSATAASSDSESDLASASIVLDDYVRNVASGNYAAAWSVLAPVSQQNFGTEANFASSSAAFMRSAGQKVVVRQVTNDPELLTKWLPAGDPNYPNQSRAFLLEVDYPNIVGPADMAIFVAAPLGSTWRVWIVN